MVLQVDVRVDQADLFLVLLRAAVDITTRAALTEKTDRKDTQREQTVSIAAAHDCLVALADGFCRGLGFLLMTVIHGYGEGGNSHQGGAEEGSHSNGWLLGDGLNSDQAAGVLMSTTAHRRTWSRSA